MTAAPFLSLLLLAVLAAATQSAPAESSSTFRLAPTALSPILSSPTDVQSWLRVAADVAAAGHKDLFKRCRCRPLSQQTKPKQNKTKQNKTKQSKTKKPKQMNAISWFNRQLSYTVRRLEANTYQFEELAMKAITIGSHALAVEILINRCPSYREFKSLNL
jgi:hypothetical protein